VASAAAENILHFRYKEGASTITQQLVKNTHLTNEKKLSRKAKEISLALKMEKQYTKEEIPVKHNLLWKLRLRNRSGGAMLVRQTCGKTFTLAESATLAAVIKAPSSYTPSKKPGKCTERRNLILRVMYEQNYISEEEFENAAAQKIVTAKTPSNTYSQCRCGSDIEHQPLASQEQQSDFAHLPRSG